MRSLFTTGDDQPRPVVFENQMTLELSFQSVGSLLTKLEPFCAGPRNSGHSFARLSPLGGTTRLESKVRKRKVFLNAEVLVCTVTPVGDWFGNDD